MLRKFAKDLMKYAPSQVLPAITAFITTPILTRLLLPAEYGYWGLATNASALLVAAAVSGYGSSVLRFYPAYAAKSELAAFFAALLIPVTTIIACITGAGVIYILAMPHLVQSFTLGPFVPLILLIFIAQSIYSIFISVVRAREMSGLFTVFQLCFSYGSLGLGLAFVLVTGQPVGGMLWGTLLSLCLILPFLVHTAMQGSKVTLRSYRSSDAATLWDYAWPLVLSNVAMWALRVSDLYIISRFRADREVGIYSAAYNISAKSIELLVGMFLLSVSPLIYRTWETMGQEATESAMAMVTRVYLLLCLPATVGVSVLAYPLIVTLTAPEYYEGYRIVGFVAASSFLWGLGNIVMLGLAIHKRSRRLALNSLAAACLHVCLQLLLVPNWGYMAAAVSTFVGYTAFLLLQAAGSRLYFKWHFPFTTLRNSAVASTIMGIAVWYFYTLFYLANDSALTSLILSMPFAVAIYAVSLFLCNEFRDDEKQYALHLWKRFKGQAAGM